MPAFASPSQERSKHAHPSSKRRRIETIEDKENVNPSQKGSASTADNKTEKALMEDLMAGLDDAATTPNGATKPVGGTFDRIFRDQFATNIANLVANSFAAFGDIDVAAFKCDEVGTISVSDTKLQLGAADFDAKKHVSVGPLR